MEPTNFWYIIALSFGTAITTVFWYFIKQLVEMLKEFRTRITTLESKQEIKVVEDRERDKDIAYNVAKIEMLERMHQSKAEETVELLMAKLKIMNSKG